MERTWTSDGFSKQKFPSGSLGSQGPLICHSAPNLVLRLLLEKADHLPKITPSICRTSCNQTEKPCDPVELNRFQRFLRFLPKKECGVSLLFRVGSTSPALNYEDICYLGFSEQLAPLLAMVLLPPGAASVVPTLPVPLFHFWR